MYIKPITYTDFFGQERTEKFYFNFTEAELHDMEYEFDGGLGSSLQKIYDAKDAVALVMFFRDLVRRAYGVPSADGRRFQKSTQLTEEFCQTQAYSDIYMEMVNNEEAATKFILEAIPSALAAKAKAELDKQTKAQLPSAN